MAKEKTQEQIRQEEIEARVSMTDKFYNEHKKQIWGCVAAVLVIGLGILAYSRFVYQPKCAEAREQAIAAGISFEAGEYELALNGDGNVLGFAQIEEEYGSKAGKAVYLYCGICELQLGNYEQAVSYLKKYKGKDSILAARALACIGDAYVGLEDYEAAAAYFRKASNRADNIFAASYLVKEGLVHEKLGDKAAALACYKTVKDKYPQSVEGYDIDRYIAAVEE